jgi:pSer/pThr/pTyr-binding forkhead associated (FHA) protein
MQINLVMFKDDERRDFPLRGDRAIIGRKLECDLRIPTGDVSREHCELSTNGVILTVRDLGSANGTFVNGKRITEAQLRAGDKLGVGPVIFVVQIDGNPAKITPHDARIVPEEIIEEPKPGAATMDDTPDFDDDDIFAEIVNNAPAGGGDDEEFDLDSLEILDEDDEEDDEPPQKSASKSPPKKK